MGYLGLIKHIAFTGAKTLQATYKYEREVEFQKYRCACYKGTYLWVKSGKFKENQEVSAVMQLGYPGLALFYDKGEITAFALAADANLKRKFSKCP